MFRQTLKKAWNALVHPEVRLKADFPWGFGSMATTYLVATGLYILGNVIAFVLFLGALLVLDLTNPGLVNQLIGDPQNPSMFIIIVPVVLSFVFGFGLELWYIRKQFHKQGLSLRKAMALNLDSLGGSWWAAIWRALAGVALVIALQSLLGFVLPEPHSPAGELAKQLNGWGMALFALMAVVGAPLFEEFVFRGFLFNVCRTSFRKGRFIKVFRTETIADWAAICVSALVFAAGHLSLSAIPFLFVTGVVLAAVYRRSGSLVTPMLLHGINNLVVTVVLFLQIGS